MKDETKERWVQLCEQAAVEKDSDRFLRLIEEINDLLEQKRRRIAPGARPDHNQPDHNQKDR